MIMNTLIVSRPAMCFALCLESQDKCINILLGKCLQVRRMRILLHEKGEKVSQTIGTEVQCTRTDSGRQFALDMLLDDRTKYLRYALKINVVHSGRWCVAQPWDQSGIPFIFCKLLCDLFQCSKCRCSLNEAGVRLVHCDFCPFVKELGQTCSRVCSQAARNASFAGWTYV